MTCGSTAALSFSTKINRARSATPVNAKRIFYFPNDLWAYYRIKRRDKSYYFASLQHTHSGTHALSPRSTLKRSEFFTLLGKTSTRRLRNFSPSRRTKGSLSQQSGSFLCCICETKKLPGTSKREATSYLWPPLCSSYSWHWQINFAIGIMSAINSALFLSACCYLPWRDNKKRCTFAQLLLSGRKGLSTMCVVSALAFALSNASGGYFIYIPLEE